MFLSLGSYAQNAFRIIKPILFKQIPLKQSLQIQRISIIETTQLENAVRATALRSQFRAQQELTKLLMIVPPDIPVAYITQDIKQSYCDPEKVYGGYNYLKVCARNLSGDSWKSINKTKAYNGVHHIVNVQTLKVLYQESQERFEKGEIKLHPLFNEMVLNAPGIFHKYHNNSAFGRVFHNPEEQLEIYALSGIKGILDKFFEDIRVLNSVQGLSQIDAEVVSGTYVEAKLWCDHFGLVWDPARF